MKLPVNKLDELLRACTVRIGDQDAGGSGFFVAPGRILTCAHVVEEEHATSTTIDVWWHDRALTAELLDYHATPYPDLALLSVEVTDHPCVWLDAALVIGDGLYSYGYPGDYRDGDSALFVYEGPGEQGGRLLKLKGGQAPRGLSGAPLLNRRTGGICGIVKRSRDPKSDLGGRAVPTSVIVSTFSELHANQQAFHQRDKTWLNLREKDEGVVAAGDQPPPHNTETTNDVRLGGPPAPVRSLETSQVSPTTVRSALPRSTRSFTGRTQELEQLQSIFQEASSRPTVLVVYGLSGVGKTQLCRKYMESKTGEYDITYWLAADNESAITSRLGQLAIDQRLPGANPKDLTISGHVAVQWLERHEGWLLVLDNASPENIGSVLPSSGSGHILISSTSPHWTSITDHRLRLQGLSPDDAVQFLQSRTNHDDEASASRIAEQLGYLPLALEQAAAYIETTGIDFQAYERLLLEHRPDLLEERSPFTDYPESVYSSLRISVNSASVDLPQVNNFLALISFMSSSGIPRALVRDGIRSYFEQVHEPFNDLVENKIISIASRASLIFTKDNFISTHSLVQAFMRDVMPSDHLTAWNRFVLSFLAQEYSPNTDDSSTWPSWEQLVDHILSAGKFASFTSWGDPDIEGLYISAGNYLHARGREEQATEVLHHAYQLAISRWGAQHPEVAGISSNYMNALGAAGQADEALRLGHRAIEILTRDEATQEDYAIDLGIIYNNVGRLYLHYKRDLRSARHFMSMALQIHLKELGPGDVAIAIDVNNLGAVDREEAVRTFKLGNREKTAQKWSDAYDHFEHAVGIYREALAPSDYRLAVAVFNLGTAALNLERLVEAEACFREAIAINEELKGGATQWDQQDAFFYLGSTLRKLGRPAESLEYFDRALELAKNLYGERAPVVIATKSNRDAAAFEVGKRVLCQYEQHYFF